MFWEWLGFGEGGEKTGLDLLQLLVALSVPVVVVVMASIFTASQSRSQRDAEEQRAQAQRDTEQQRAQAQRDVERQRAQDEALQVYLEDMGRLLLDEDLLDSQEDAPVHTLARARTLTTLGRVDDVHKRSIVQFLNDSRLIAKDKPVVHLFDANLIGVSLRDFDMSDANLSNADLLGTDLTGTELSGATLSGASLSGANLEDVDLSEIDLRGANLDGAHLSGTNLSGTNLNGAALVKADLREADLSEANLKEADLSGATVTNEQLGTAQSLEGANDPSAPRRKRSAPEGAYLTSGPNLFECYTFYANGDVELRTEGSSDPADRGHYTSFGGKIRWESGRMSSVAVKGEKDLIMDARAVSKIFTCTP